MIDVIKPTLLLNKEKSFNNIIKIQKNLTDSKIELRPHFKTHQSNVVGNWFKELGIKKITVSSVTMAKYFSKYWDDITIAFPVNILELDDVIMLQEKIKINLLVDSYDVLEILEKKIKNKINIYLKVNVGYNRAGVDYESDSINDIISYSDSSSKLNFKGFLTHFGDTYNSKSSIEIRDSFENSINKISDLNKKFPDYEISIGDTPSSSLVNKYPEFITEIRPGNFVFYDLDQLKIGSCQIEQIAIRLVCPVISIYKKRNSLLLYGGSVHFSKDYIVENNNKCYGYVYHGDYWSLENKIGYIKSLSQEHGIVELEKNINLKIGDKLSIIPVHSCLTVDKMREFYINDNKFKIMT